jgi:hypothetical protein
MWWNQPLLDYEQKRMWMSDGYKDTAQYLPDRFEREHHPNTLTLFDDILCHPFTKPSKGRADIFDQNHTSGQDPSQPDFEGSSTQRNLVGDSVEFTIGSLSPMNSIEKQASKQFYGSSTSEDPKMPHKQNKSSSSNANADLGQPRRTSVMSVVDIMEETKQNQKWRLSLPLDHSISNKHTAKNKHERGSSHMATLMSPPSKDGALGRHQHNDLFIGCLRSTKASENMEKYFSVYFTFMRDPRLHMTMINVHQKKWFRQHLFEFSLSENDPKGNREAQSKASAVTVLRTSPYRYMKQSQSATDPKILLNTILEVDSEKVFYEMHVTPSNLCDLQSSLSNPQSVAMYTSFFDTTSIDCEIGSSVSSVHEKYVDNTVVSNLYIEKKQSIGTSKGHGHVDSSQLLSCTLDEGAFLKKKKRENCVDSVADFYSKSQVEFPLTSAVLVKSGQYILLNEAARGRLGKV